jgi:hypothetical protein
MSPVSTIRARAWGMLQTRSVKRPRLVDANASMRLDTRPSSVAVARVRCCFRVVALAAPAPHPSAASHATRHSRRRAAQSSAQCSFRLVALAAPSQHPVLLPMQSGRLLFVRSDRWHRGTANYRFCLKAVVASPWRRSRPRCSCSSETRTAAGRPSSAFRRRRYRAMAAARTTGRGRFVTLLRVPRAPLATSTPGGGASRAATPP